MQPTGETKLHRLVTYLEERVGLGRPMLHLCIRLLSIYSSFFPLCNGTVVHACQFTPIKRECEFEGCSWSFCVWALFFHLVWFNLIHSWKGVSFDRVFRSSRIRFSCFWISLVLHRVVQKQLFWSNSSAVTPPRRRSFKKVMRDCWVSGIT